MIAQTKRQAALIETFMAAGMVRDEASIWSALTVTSLRAVAIAYKRLRRQKAWDAQRAIRPEKKMGEVDISVALFHEIDRLKDRFRIDNPLRDIEFVPELPVESRTRRGPTARRMDFRIKRRFGSRRTASLAVEAKLLRQHGDVTSAYLGEDGLGCFLTTDSTYTRERVALMFAYSAAQEHPPWANLIEGALRGGEYGATLHAVQPQFGIALHSGVPRPALELPDISILHLVFAFPPN
ncbi:hypothetical protein [Methylorubrum zatmanii]|uniref:Uncharacterized protein n=1 Tax=Methylorubrum zatmanii TaxID=29429 RepID=A0ABW1WQW5_9HYPH|nr:hypothetical protein [Methylorubrum zatmanii]MBD8906048.1 hypothetical protein [Methylorubrum zatmanii]